MKNAVTLFGAAMAEWGLGLIALGGFFSMIVYWIFKMQ